MSASTDSDLTAAAVSKALRGQIPAEVLGALQRLAARAGLPGMIRMAKVGFDHDVTPLAKLLIAKAMADAWQRAQSDAVIAARTEDVSWEQIGAACGLGGDAGKEAFARFGGRWQPGYAIVWACGGDLGCGQAIRDHGPGPSYLHPADREKGHADGCARAARELADWQAQQDELDGA